MPLGLKIAYALWMAVWVPVYWSHNGPSHFLWLCDVANWLIGIGLWLESRLLLSSQAVGVLLIQVAWSLDFLAALLFGFHPLGATGYMFDPARPLYLRSLSLFHLVVPVLLLWAVRRFGYDRRGLTLQTALTVLLLPATYLVTEPVHNVNWLWQLFERPAPLPGWWWVVASVFLYPIVVYLPSHGVLVGLERWLGWPRPSAP